MYSSDEDARGRNSNKLIRGAFEGDGCSDYLPLGKFHAITWGVNLLTFDQGKVDPTLIHLAIQSTCIYRNVGYLLSMYLASRPPGRQASYARLAKGGLRHE